MCFDVDAGGIDDRPGLQFVIGAVFLIAGLDADDLAATFDEAYGFNIIDGHAAEIFQRAQQCDSIAGIVKLAVVIENTATQAVAFDAREFFECGLAGEHLGMAEGKFSREAFIDFEAHPVIRKRKIAVGGDDEVEIVDQVGRVAQHVAAFAQSIENQREVHLLEVAHAAVHQFGAAAGGLLGEVGALHQQSAIAARCGLNGGAEAGGPTADHQYVPGRRIAAEFLQNFIAFGHAGSFLS